MAIDELAWRLWEARRTGHVLPLAEIAAPVSAEEAYAVQARVVALSGLASLGFKVGSTSIEAQRKLGTTEPGSAPLLAPYVFASPARITLAAGHDPAVEGEFAFRLGRDLSPRDTTYAEAEVADAVDAVAGAIEVVGSRISGGLTGIGRFLSTADCGVNIALVCGAWTRDWRSLDLRSHRVTMSVDGQIRGEGTGARALGDPMRVMVWLANQQSALGRGLKAGEIVATGTCTGLDTVASGNRARADFGSLGSVEIAFA